MFLIVNLLGIFVFIAIAALFSNDRKNIPWRSVGVVLALEIALAWFFTQFKAGQIAVQGAADGFNWLVSVASKGIAFALPEWLTSNNGGPNFVTSALLPILLVVPLFDILTYIGLLPWLIKWIGKGLAFVTGQPKFEAFFSIEMMFLGNTEVLAVSKNQLDSMSARRNFTLAMMSMSCVTSAIIGSYTQMVPGNYVLTASIMAGKGFFANEHARVVLTVFLTSFANFGTIGMIIGCFKGLVNKEKNDYISARVPYMLLAGVLVSLLSAATAGLFVW